MSENEGGVASPMKGSEQTQTVSFELTHGIFQTCLTLLLLAVLVCGTTTTVYCCVTTCAETQWFTVRISLFF